jgi:hypothetical protein
MGAPLVGPQFIAHNPKVTGSNPVPATKQLNGLPSGKPFLFLIWVTPGLRAVLLPTNLPARSQA